MKERIEAIIRHERITPSQLADTLGVQRSGVSHILSGRNKPSLDFLYKLLTCFPYLSGDWLITGKGEMLINTGSKPQTTNGQLNFTEPEKTPKKVLKVPQKSIKREVEPVVQSKTEVKEEPQLPASIFNSGSDKKIERILVFYSDKTFREYQPE